LWSKLQNMQQKLLHIFFSFSVCRLSIDKLQHGQTCSAVKEYDGVTHPPTPAVNCEDIKQTVPYPHAAAALRLRWRATTVLDALCMNGAISQLCVGHQRATSVTRRQSLIGLVLCHIARGYHRPRISWTTTLAH